MLFHQIWNWSQVGWRGGRIVEGGRRRVEGREDNGGEEEEEMGEGREEDSGGGGGDGGGEEPLLHTHTSDMESWLYDTDPR